MSKTGEYFLETAERNNWNEADKYYEELKNDEYGCPHKAVLTEKLEGESITDDVRTALVCEDCGEDLTEEIEGESITDDVRTAIG